MAVANLLLVASLLREIVSNIANTFFCVQVGRKFIEDLKVRVEYSTPQSAVDLLSLVDDIGKRFILTLSFFLCKLSFPRCLRQQKSCHNSNQQEEEVRKKKVDKRYTFV